MPQARFDLEPVESCRDTVPEGTPVDSGQAAARQVEPVPFPKRGLRSRAIGRGFEHQSDKQNSVSQQRIETGIGGPPAEMGREP